MTSKQCRRMGRAAASLALGLAMSGCKPDAAVKKAEVLDRDNKAQGAAGGGAANPGAAGPAGEVSGTISVTGKVPAPVLIDTSMDPACGLSGGEVHSEQYAVRGGKLANVFVYVKSGPAAAMQSSGTPGKAVVIDQKGCQYAPHVIGVMQGGTVEFRNSDPTMHNVHTMPADGGNPTVDVSQGPRGTPQDKQFQKPELMIPVRCNNHPWMNAFINVSQTPFFAVTDEKGHFDLKGLPPGDYIVGADQEKMGEKTMHVTVQANGTATADFSFAAK